MSKRRGSGPNPNPISGKTAAELEIVSSVEGPLRELSRLRRSLLFAEISMLSYLSDDEARPVFADIGFPDIRYIERDGAQAYEMANDTDVVIVCRGTEPNEWNDIKADAKRPDRSRRDHRAGPSGVQA